MKLARILLTLPLVAAIFVALARATRHFAWGWPAHAQHHLVQHIGVSFGLAAVSLILVGSPLQRGEWWAWWTLLLAGVCLYGSHWIGNLAVGLGEDGRVPNTAQAIQSGIYVLGLAWSFRALRSRV